MNAKSGGVEDEKSPLIVTRGDGIPLPDQAAALAEFKRQCLQSGKSDRQRRHELLDMMIRILHYQEHGDGTTLESPFADVAAAWNGELPPALLHRYRNDPKFHAQVQRAVAFVQEVMR